MLKISISTYDNGTPKVSVIGTTNNNFGVCLTEEEGDFYRVVGDDPVPQGTTIIDPTITCDRYLEGMGLSAAISLLTGLAVSFLLIICCIIAQYFFPLDLS
jgi:hypothetical protein